MDQFIKEDGDRALMSMKNFTVSEFNGMWNQVQEHLSPRYNTGRGSKSPIKAKGLFFMSVCVLKHGSKWDLMAYLFEMNPRTFEKRVTIMIAITSDFLYTALRNRTQKSLICSDFLQTKLHLKLLKCADTPLK